MAQKKKPRKSKKSTKHFSSFLKFTFIVIILGTFLVAGVGAGLIAALVKDDPVRSPEEIRSKVFTNNLTGFAYFSNKNKSGSYQLIGMLRADEDRRIIEFDEIPKNVYNAFLAIEDRDFETHFGINIKALGRAVLQQLLNSDVRTGGSTITQQLAKNTFYSFDKTFERKAKEIFLALRMERILSKEEIFTAYINKIHFGKAANLNNVYGIQAAAKGYFNKDAEDLNLAEAAFLAGIPQRPTAYSSFNSQGFDEEGYQLAKERQELVLKRMLEEGFITTDEYEEALAYDIKEAFSSSASDEKAYNRYPYLMLEIENRAAEKLIESLNMASGTDDYNKVFELARQKLLTGGYKVYTTIDRTVYEAMNAVAKNPDNFNKPISYDFEMRNGKVIPIENALEEVGATLIENKTGAILGFVGGRDFYTSQINHSNFRGSTKRQPGSSIKPLLDYAPALELGYIQPATPIDDIPLGTEWEPENWNKKYNGRITAREALNWSFNIPAVKVYKMVGIDKGYEYYTKLGFRVNEKFFKQAGYTPAIGTIETSPERMANAYTTFANGGTYIDAYLIEKIEDKDGNIVYQHQSKPEVVFSEQTAFLITDMLRTVISNGTGGIVRKFIGNELDVAGKTGTTNDSKDLWFIGYTPEVTLGVWVGYDFPYKLKTGSIASQTWGRILSEVLKAKPELSATDAKFTRPEGIVKMEVSSTSGKLPSELTKEAGYLVSDWFNKKYIPTEIDDSLEKARVITFDDTRYLAKPETPDDMVEIGIYFKREPYVLPYKKDKEGEILKDENGEGIRKDRPVDYEKELPNQVDPRTSTGENLTPPLNPLIKIQSGKNILSWDKLINENVVGYRIYRTSTFEFGFIKVGVVKQTNLEPNRLYFEDVVEFNDQYAYYITTVDVMGNESKPTQLLGFNLTNNEQLDNNNPFNEENMNDNIEGNTDIIPGQNNDQIAIAIPSAPKNLGIMRIGLQITLTWDENPPDDYVTKYNIYYSSKLRGDYNLIGSSIKPEFSYELLTDKKGFFYVTAVNNKGESDRSRIIQVRTQ
ncbi:hypothetical protein BHF71_09770 [Vulcanibacillus modesticaldus]|uniref:Uncharacterized protein n=1 Tax=Vulcanibacillus modesticaldus TaxID=337097 RepID=A0A1D2YU08_9BACI|nr:penicillin-binding protein 1A [Vulcanibacillus modesticaldus]OEF99192.1 hypothetical protein BHF71_09770 [Vulcanibacillus modesticaldus]